MVYNKVWKNIFIIFFQKGVKFFITYADTYNERVNLIAKYIESEEINEQRLKDYDT